MKKLRRWHLFLGCFFTPLLCLYLFSGFIMTRWPAEQKGPGEAQSFIQKLYWVHKHQSYPITPKAPPESAAIASVDTKNDTLTAAAPHNYQSGQPGTITPFSPAGIKTDEEYFIHVVDAQSITLHKNEPDAATGANPVDITGKLEEGFSVFFKPPAVPPRGIDSYNKTGFRWLVYAMALGVLGTMALGVVLAIRVTKDKRPVYLALGLGVLVPVLLLWLGQIMTFPTTAPPSIGNPESPGRNADPPGQRPGTPPGTLPEMNTTQPPGQNSTEPIDPFSNP